MEEKQISKTFSVSGMTCVNCENRIENKLKKLDGVTDVTASYTRSRVSFTYDPDCVKLSTIVQSIESMEYHVKRAGEKQNVAAYDKGTFRLSSSSFQCPLHHHLSQSQYPAQLTDTATGFLLNLSDQLIPLVYRQFSQIPIFGVMVYQISQSFIRPSHF